MSKEEQHSKLDESLKKALESIDSAYSPDDWSDLEQRMNQHTTFKKVPNKNQGFKFGKGFLLNTFIICGTIAAASASFALFYSTSNGSKQATSGLTPAASDNSVQNNANSLTPLLFNNNTLPENEISTETTAVAVNNTSGAPGGSEDAEMDADKNNAPEHEHSLKINTTSEKENISANENNSDNANRKLNANARNTVTNRTGITSDKLAVERTATKNSSGHNKYITSASSSKNDGKHGLEANKVSAKATITSLNKPKARDKILAEKVTDVNHTSEENSVVSLNNNTDKKENASYTKVAAEKTKSINSKKSNKTYSSNKLNTNTNGAITKQKQVNANNVETIINSSNLEPTGATQNTNETVFATMRLMKAKGDLLQNNIPLAAPAIKPAAVIVPENAIVDGSPKSISSAASDNYFVNFWENPGYTGAEERHTVNAAYKNQWVQLRNNPVDFALGYNGAVGKNKKNGIGIYFGGTDATFSTKRVLGIAYSYKLTFNAEHIVRIGLGISSNHKGVNTSSYTDNSMIDPVKGFVRKTSTMYTNSGWGYLDPNVGIWYGFRRFYFGVSALRLTQPREHFYGSGYELPALFYINTGYRFSLNNSWSLTPSIAVKHTYGVYTNYNPLILLTYKDDVFAGVTYQNFNMCSVQAGATLFRSLRLFVSAGTPANKKLKLLGSLGTVEAGIRYQLPSHAKTETK